MSNRYCKNFFTKTCRAQSNPQTAEDFIAFRDCDAGFVESDICLACDTYAMSCIEDDPTVISEEMIPCKFCLFNIMNQLIDDPFDVTDAQMAFGLQVFRRIRTQEWGDLLDDPALSKLRAKVPKCP